MGRRGTVLYLGKESDKIQEIVKKTQGKVGHSSVLRLQMTLTSLTSRLPRSRPYLATTGRNTSVTGLVGLALSPTDRLIGTRSSLEVGQGNIFKTPSSGSTMSQGSPRQNRIPQLGDPNNSAPPCTEHSLHVETTP